MLRRRTGEARTQVRQITGELAVTSRLVVAQARNVARNARMFIYRKGDRAVSNLRKLVNSLEKNLQRTGQIIEQAEAVNEGNLHLPDRLVSLFDADARPIKKGKLKAHTEFGYKVLLAEAEHKIITDYQVLKGNPSDESLLLPTIDQHIKTFKHPPRCVATDRGFSSRENEDVLKERGVKKISIPRKGKLGSERKAYQSQSWFKRLQRWRAGGEATISLLKRKFGLHRSLMRGYSGTQIWTGLGILSANLYRIAVLL